jgi:4-carboxymuconolactone decarboxylase
MAARPAASICKDWEPPAMQKDYTRSIGKPPRLAPLEEPQWNEEVRAALKNWSAPFNFHKTMAYNPVTLKEWIPFGEAILFRNALPPREREIVILRVAYNLRCDYEWGAHASFSLREKWLNEAELARLAHQVPDAQWTESEAALIRATDDIVYRGEIGDAQWAMLSNTFTPAQLIDLIFVAGNFMMLASFMKSFRIPLDAGLHPFPSHTE